MSTLWHGRFEGRPAEDLLAFTVSLPFDQRLAGDDIVEEEFDSGRFVFEPGDEDIHTAVERRVTELAGPAGAKLHTGRSRNDQVATDLRLWCKRELVVLAGGVVQLQAVLLDQAEAAGTTALPTQRCMLSRSISDCGSNQRPS